MKHYATLVQKWEEDQYAPKAASTVFQNGGWITYDGSGYVIPATPGDALLGVGQEDVLASDVDYTSHRMIAYQAALNNYFNMDVTTGTATAAMVGSTFDLDTAETLDVSGAGTQFVITKFISATQVEVKAVLLA